MELKSKFNIEVLVLCFDVRDKDEIVKSIESLNDKWKKIDVLINIAESIYFVATQPNHININDLLIMPMAQANATTFDKK